MQFPQGPVIPVVGAGDLVHKIEMGAIFTITVLGKIIDKVAETLMGAAPFIIVQAVEYQLKDI